MASIASKRTLPMEYLYSVSSFGKLIWNVESAMVSKIALNQISVLISGFTKLLG